MPNYKKQTATIQVLDDSGQELLVYEFTSFIDTTNLSSKTRTYRPGLKEYRLGDGKPVNLIDADTFETVFGAMKLRRV